MVRPMPQRLAARPIQLDPATPGIALVDADLWYPCKGLNYKLHSSQVDRGYVTEMANFRVFSGRLEARDGMVAIGDAASSTVLSIVKFITAARVGFLIRFKTDGADYWNGTIWTPLPGSLTLTFTATSTDRYTWTLFGDRLVFSNGKDGLYVFDPTIMNTYKIEGSFPARFLSSMAGRIIAGDVRDPVRHLQRIRWSVKFDMNDWTGTGSGFEDLEATPGGGLDQQLGIFPISDYTTLLVRSTSIWQMTATGEDADSPYRFTRLYSDMICDAPYSVTSIPGAIAGLWQNDFFVIGGAESLNPIGILIKDKVALNTVDKIAMSATYDYDRQEYLVADGNGNMYGYSFIDKAWFKFVHTSPVRWITMGLAAFRGVTIDELAGTINGLSGTIDDLSGTVKDNETGVLELTSGNIVGQEGPNAIDDYGAAQVMSVESGLIVANDKRHNTRMINILLEYELDDSALDIIIEYSKDGGATWNTFTTDTLPVTTGRAIRSYSNEVQGHELKVRLRAARLAHLTIYSLTPQVYEDVAVRR